MLGDAVPKKQFLKHEEFFTYNLLVVGFILTFLRRGYFAACVLVQIDPGFFCRFVEFLLCFAVGMGLTHLVRTIGFYTMFKLYPEGYGAGLNFYYKGWRMIGVDWHQWQVRQHLKTGKPLHPSEQYLLNRPHIDLPPWEMHHWPWVRHPWTASVESVKQKKSEIRAEKYARKEAKRIRREAQLAARSTQSSPGIDSHRSHKLPEDDSDPTSNLLEQLTVQNNELNEDMIDFGGFGGFDQEFETEQITRPQSPLSDEGGDYSREMVMDILLDNNETQLRPKPDVVD